MPYHHLTREERHTISSLHCKGHSASVIADIVHRSKSTITRELKRNASSPGRYNHLEAHQRAKCRLSQAPCRASRICKSSWDFAKQMISQEQWSPDQVSADLARNKRSPISHETIYQRIYEDARHGGVLYRQLRRKRKPYRSRKPREDRRGKITNQISIEQRPSVVDEKTRIGAFEVDTVIGKHSGSAPVLVTLVDRLSRFTLIAKARNKTALAVSEALLRAALPHRQKFRTLTYDNGKEPERSGVRQERKRRAS